VGFLPDAVGTVTSSLRARYVVVLSSSSVRVTTPFIAFPRYRQQKVVCFTHSTDIIKSAGVIAPSQSGVLQPRRASAHASAHITSSHRRCQCALLRRLWRLHAITSKRWCAFSARRTLSNILASMRVPTPSRVVLFDASNITTSVSRRHLVYASTLNYDG